MLEILYEDRDLIAIHKPHGLLVHRTRLARDARTFALQELRNQIGQHVYPAHRLDRKTAGVLLFAKSPEVNKDLQGLFRNQKVVKTYRAIVRGYTAETGVIDYPLGEKKQEAISSYKTLSHYEIPYPSHQHKTSRYSEVELHPIHGRFHQLRKHMAHIMHPIIGDRPHGCNKQNRFWKHTLKMDRMFLICVSLSFTYNDKGYEIHSPPSDAYQKALDLLEDLSLSALQS